MNIHNVDIDIDLLEFRDRYNIMRSTAGCSFKGKIEFDARLKIAREILNSSPQKTIAELYQENLEFQHHCDRCLQLNGVEPEWLTDRHLVALLFIHKNSVGALVSLNAVNNPEKAENKGSKAGGNLYHQFLGGLYSLTQDPEQAIRLAEERPFKEVMGMVKYASDAPRRDGQNQPQQTKRSPNTSKDPLEVSDRNFIKIKQAREMIKNRQ